MITLISSIFLLFLGYKIYGKIVERAFGIDAKRTTPAHSERDDVDFTPLTKTKNGLIEVLNIAGTGPVYGAILGVIWGPMAFVWIVVGAIFAGGVQDYLIGMMSVRHRGAHLPQMTEQFLGKWGKRILVIFLFTLLILVGTTFVKLPARLLNDITPDWISELTITMLIFAYYFLSTILPIHQWIGKIYPFLGIAFLGCTVWIAHALLSHPHALVELQWSNWHPKDASPFPSLFIVLSCGALSGFHATQAPLISRTLNSERDGKAVFYGMMLLEAVIALIWAAATMAFFDHNQLANIAINGQGDPSLVVTSVTELLLGPVGKIIAIAGIVILPLTSGDTAFRSARMIVGDAFSIKQRKAANRLLLATPLFILSALLRRTDFRIIWLHFSLANQTVACLALWLAALYLKKYGKWYGIAAIPALFMTMTCLTYFFQDPVILNFAFSPAQSFCLATAITLTGMWLYYRKSTRKAVALS